MEPVIGVKLEQLHQMAVSTNPNLGGRVIQLASHLSDVKNYWGFQGYSPFQMDSALKTSARHVQVTQQCDVFVSQTKE